MKYATFTELIEKLDKAKIVYFIPYEYDEDTDEELESTDKIVINWCEIGDNFYDYDESYPNVVDVSKEWEGIDDNPHVILRPCEDCCRCGSW